MSQTAQIWQFEADDDLRWRLAPNSADPPVMLRQRVLQTRYPLVEAPKIVLLPPFKAPYSMSRVPERRSMPDSPLSLAEIEERIAAVRENLTELIEQAAAYSGGATEELTAQRIADQEAQLELLTRQRDERLRRKRK